MEYEKWEEDKIAKVAILCKTKQDMKMRFPKEYAAAKRMGLLSTPMFSHMPKRLKNSIPSKWNKKENVLKEAKKFLSRKAFFEGNQSCYNAAKRMGWFEEACMHMPKNLCIGNKPPTFKWPKIAVVKEALKYDSKKDFAESSAGAYDAAVKNKWLDEVCSHMPTIYRDLTVKLLVGIFKDCKTKKEAREKDLSAYVTVTRKKLQKIVFAHMPKRIDKSGKNSPFYRWTDEELREVALKYGSRAAFLEKNPAAYQAAYKRWILDEICVHMGEPITKAWEYEDLVGKALKHNSRSVFQKEDSGAYQTARKRRLLDEICSHMKRSVSTSSQEQILFDKIKTVYSKTQKLVDRKVKIEGKPHIKGFDIDIYIPELRKGIEFDGRYWHSIEGLRRGREHWPEEDIRNYSKLKDGWFASKGIQILHIGEEEWKLNKDACVERCLEFLGV